MKDKLEDFIHQNRNAFDDRQPPENVWKNIDQQLFGKHASWWNSVRVWRAAAVVFMLLSGYLLVPKTGLKPLLSDGGMKEFHDVEAFYIQQISEKVDQIDSFQRNEGMNGYTNDFQQLEAMYYVLKEEVKIRPSQKVKDALVLNLLVRINLLNQQLHKLEEEMKPETNNENQSSV